MRVTIVLLTGGFFPPERNDQTFLDVGYFETPGPTDIEVSEDGQIAQPQPHRKLGRGNKRIDVQHIENDGVTVKKPVNPSDSFKNDILKKDKLYAAADAPAFIKTAYDCVLRFHSGDFSSADVRDRSFTQHSLSDDSLTGIVVSTENIANEIHVDYDLADGETLRLQGPGGNEIWSSSSVGTGTKSVVLRFLTDDLLNPVYHKQALAHKVQHYYLPNSDPPPMNGP
ncbi:MAG TPA: hypothetical protein VLM38_01365 [Blastocatellia bacterium]|nr:hypothetical protein [Blastocatellia bacterium]